MSQRFRTKQSLPELPKGAERAIVEQFRSIQADLDDIRGPQRSTTAVTASDCLVRVGELLLAAPPAGGMNIGIPPATQQNISRTLRIAVVGGVLSPGATVSIIGGKGTINGTPTLTLTSRGMTELTSVGDSGWVAVAVTTGGGGLPPDGDYGDITVSGAGTVWTVDAGAVAVGDLANIADETFVGNVSGGAAPPAALALSSLAGTNLVWNSALNRLDASGGGAAAMTDATITLPYTEDHSGTAVVIDAAIGAGSNVGIFWGDVLETDENSPEMDAVTFTCIPAAGSMTVRVSSDKEPVGGDYKIRYLIG
jgi:hypothetical protein